MVDGRDHSAGNSEWKHRFTGIKIYGGALDAVPAATEYVYACVCVCVSTCILLFNHKLIK